MESDFTIIKNTVKAQNKYDKEMGTYGGETYMITKDDIQALLDGKQLATTINRKRVFNIYHFRGG